MRRGRTERMRVERKERDRGSMRGGGVFVVGM